MSELALFIVRIAFLVVLWTFVFTIISVIRADLFGQKVVSRVAEANTPQRVSQPVIPAAPSNSLTEALMSEPSGVNATKVVVTEGSRRGTEVRLVGRELTIGRAENSDLVIDDEYASTQHAKLVLINNDWLIQDLNSTNGTYIGENRVGTPAVIKVGQAIRIGKTVFELRA